MRRLFPLVVFLLVLLSGCASNPTPARDFPTPTGESTTWHSRSPPGATSPAGHGTGRVVTVIEVVDGDTANVRYANGTRDTIRLLGVDAPETHVESDPHEFEGIPDTSSGRDWLSRWGQRAGEYLRTRIASEEVRIVTDERADRRGDYGRLLVYAYHDGVLLNLRLLQCGYARLYDSSFGMRARFANAERRAREAGRGLWGYEGGRANRVPDQTCEPPSTHSVSPVT